jgi:hypothetical protein
VALLQIAMGNLANAESLETQKKALDLIGDTADRVCNVVTAAGQAQSSEVQGQVKAALGGLASRLADVGVSGSGKIDDEQYTNVLREQLADTLKDNAACKLKVFDTLQSKLLSTTPQDQPKEIESNKKLFAINDYVGEWVNVDPKTRGITRLLVQRSGPALTIHTWGRCHPSDCDGGAATANPLGENVSHSADQPIVSLSATFLRSFEEERLTLRLLEPNKLTATSDRHFTDKSGRADYEITATFSRF